MRRCYEIGAFALAAIVYLSASNDAGAQNSLGAVGHNAQSAITRERLNRATDRDTVISEPDPGCPQGMDNRKSDLCAQWKAADASAGSLTVAWWSFFAGIIGLIVGALTLFFASRAAHWAKEAARHTETGANEAKKSAQIAQDALDDARRASLPQLTVSVGFYKTNDGAQNHVPRCYLSISVRNSGDVMAQNVTVHHVRLSLSDGRFENLLLWSQQGAEFKSLEPGRSENFGPFSGDKFVLSHDDIVSGRLIDLLMTAKIMLNVTDRLGTERLFEEVWNGVVHEAFDGPILRVNFERAARVEIGEAAD